METTAPKVFNKIYLQVKDYDGSENSETTITWSPVRVNESDIEYILAAELSEPKESRLSEVKESGNEVTDEMIEKEFPTNIYKLAESLHIPKDLMSAEMSEALKGIQEGNENKQMGAKWLRSQLHPAPPLTEEQIEKWAETLYSKTYGAKYIQLIIKGAKAMRDGIITDNLK